MNERTWKAFKLLLLAASVMAFVDYRLTLGYFLGAFTSIFLYKRIERFCDSMISAMYASNKQAFVGFMLNYLVMGIVLVLAAKLPHLFNLFTCALGLMAIKIAVIAEAIFNKGSEAI
ncbi:MAG: hypothetical protein IJ875_02850 [Solobacterium sp.]|nr:hypothetical protein [Solobacterium sp.]